MTRLELDAKSYEGSYKLVAGELSLDFVNTISWPDTRKHHDWLDPPHNLFLWAEAVGLKVPKKMQSLPNGALEKAIRKILQIRRNLKSVLEPLVLGEIPPANSVSKLEMLVAKASKYRYIDTSVYQWKWKEADSLFGLIAPVIWNAGVVLTEVDHSRIGSCRGCGWLFIDSTRNRSRKWCDMEDCGSRDKALRYYHRNK